MRWDATTVRMLQEAAARSAEDTVMSPEFSSRLVDSIAASITDNLTKHPEIDGLIKSEIDNAADRISREMGEATAAPWESPLAGEIIARESKKAAEEVWSNLHPHSGANLALFEKDARGLVLFLAKVVVGVYAAISVIRWLTGGER